jgi:glutamine amidotransferase
VLPGVGAFDRGVERLRATGWWEPILDFAAAGKQVLGVCLGMQLLGESSEEGSARGLGLLRARSVRFPAEVDGRRLKVPHMGWNEVRALREAPLLGGLETEARFYFAHSYRLVCDDPTDVVAVAEYGGQLAAYVRRGAVQGVQFHPEKSHRFGLRLFKNFVART